MVILKINTKQPDSGDHILCTCVHTYTYIHMYITVTYVTQISLYSELIIILHILHLLPDNYELNVGKLLNCISNDQICAILSRSNSTIANMILLDCLIEKMSCREELLDLCCQLENITTSDNLKIIINEIRSG